MSFLLRLLRAVVALRSPASERDGAQRAAASEAAVEEKPAAKPLAVREPRNLLSCSLKLRPMEKSHEVRQVNRGAFTRIIVNTKERVRLTGGFDKEARGAGVYSKAPPSPDMPMRDLRSRPPGQPKRRPALVLLPGGRELDGEPRGALRDASSKPDGSDEPGGSGGA